MAAEREDAAREQHAADTVSTRDTSGSTRDRQADHEAAHEKFGGMNLGACFFGWLVAIAVTVLLTGIVGAIVAAISSTDEHHPVRGRAPGGHHRRRRRRSR